MSIVAHDELPIHEVPRIKTRVLVGADRGSTETTVWEQWIDPDGYIPMHFHEVEEVLVFLSGEVALTHENETSVIQAPATAVIPARQIHGLRAAGSTQIHMLAFFPTASPTIIATDGGLRPMPWEDRENSDPPN